MTKTGRSNNNGNKISGLSHPLFVQYVICFWLLISSLWLAAVRRLTNWIVSLGGICGSPSSRALQRNCSVFCPLPPCPRCLVMSIGKRSSRVRSCRWKSFVATVSSRTVLGYAVSSTCSLTNHVRMAGGLERCAVQLADTMSPSS